MKPPGYADTNKCTIARREKLSRITFSHATNNVRNCYFWIFLINITSYFRRKGKYSKKNHCMWPDNKRNFERMHFLWSDVDAQILVWRTYDTRSSRHESPSESHSEWMVNEDVTQNVNESISNRNLHLWDQSVAHQSHGRVATYGVVLFSLAFNK